ncbi:HSD5, partial [Symbiodinium microadriaticum]
SFFLEKMAEDVNVRQFMDVNYYGCVYPTVAALPHLHTSAGRIVVVSSLGGIMPFPRQTLYNASKYALVGFFDTLRMELQSKRSQ